MFNISSTIRSISERNDCNIIFGKQTSQEYKNVNLPEIKKLEDFQDFLTIRAKADSEALRIKHSDEGIFNAHRPKGKIALKLYEIAEKIRYEKIGSDTFKGIKENLSKSYKKSKEKLNNNQEKQEHSEFTRKFEESLREVIFKGETNKNYSQTSKKIKKNGRET